MSCFVCCFIIQPGSMTSQSFCFDYKRWKLRILKPILLGKRHGLQIQLYAMAKTDFNSLAKSLDIRHQARTYKKTPQRCTRQRMPSHNSYLFHQLGHDKTRSKSIVILQFPAAKENPVEGIQTSQLDYDKEQLGQYASEQHHRPRTIC